MSRVWLDTWGVWGTPFTVSELGWMLNRTRNIRDQVLCVCAVYGGSVASIPYTVTSIENWAPLWWASGGVVAVLLAAWHLERKAQRLLTQLSIARLCE